MAQVQLELILVPGGVFTMGEGEDAHEVDVAGFYMAKYPVTNMAYQEFVAATGYPAPRHWSGKAVSEVLYNHPVNNVTWQDALAYCAWLTQSSSLAYRLPCEAEWEKAARGIEGNIYPWGNDFDKTKCNCWEAAIGWTTPVSAYPQAFSPYGIADMVGNVWEWCSSLYAGYPYNAGDGREDLKVEGWRVLRGSSWLDYEWGLRAARRLSGQPTHTSHNTGFRVAYS
jgi:toxoflavin biosynthesis protein ToxD